jgi:hypothetical protein
MGMIQQNINQGLSIAAFLFSQTDYAKTQQEAHRLTKQIKTGKEALAIGEKERGYIDPELAKNIHAKAQELYNIKPSIKNLEEEEIAYSVMEGAQDEARKGQERIATSIAEKEQAAADKKAGEEASQTIRSAIMDPFGTADAELQKALETKREINKRKGGIM